MERRKIWLRESLPIIWLVTPTVIWPYSSSSFAPKSNLRCYRLTGWEAWSHLRQPPDFLQFPMVDEGKHSGGLTYSCLKSSTIFLKIGWSFVSQGQTTFTHTRHNRGLLLGTEQTFSLHTPPAGVFCPSLQTNVLFSGLSAFDLLSVYIVEFVFLHPPLASTSIWLHAPELLCDGWTIAWLTWLSHIDWLLRHCRTAQ